MLNKQTGQFCKCKHIDLHHLLNGVQRHGIKPSRVAETCTVDQHINLKRMFSAKPIDLLCRCRIGKIHYADPDIDRIAAPDL